MRLLQSAINSSKAASVSLGESTLLSKRSFRKYSVFFLKDLLESKVLSPKETLAAFDELIEIAKDA